MRNNPATKSRPEQVGEIGVKNYNQLSNALPSGLSDRLDAVGESLRKSFWEIGDIANEVVAFVKANDLPFDLRTIYSVIGDKVDRGLASVRDYAECAAFYPVKIRRKYDLLPFSHFNYSRYLYGDDVDGRPLWEKALDAAQEYARLWSKKPSERVLYAITAEIRNVSKANKALRGLSPHHPHPPILNNSSVDVFDAPGPKQGFYLKDDPTEADRLVMSAELRGAYQVAVELVEKLLGILQHIQKLEEVRGQFILSVGVARMIMVVQTGLEAIKISFGGTESGIYAVHKSDMEVEE
jgi:hypothetical protein